MNSVKKIGIVITGLLILVLQGAVAQESSDEAAVWSVIETQWQRQQSGDKKWIEELLVADFVAWPKDSPAPQNRASTRMWYKFSTAQEKILEHELYPLSIIVHGDMAVAHYLFKQASEDKDDKVTISNGRYTDILVRDEGRWRFISWHGGNSD